MSITIVTSTRSAQGMGLEQAEACYLQALARHASYPIRVVGGRGARRYARRLRGRAVRARWVPARPSRLPYEATLRGDLIHLAGLTLPPPRRKPFVVTVHDLAALRFPDEGEMPQWAGEIFRKARLVLTPSAFTRSELAALVDVEPERVRVVGSGPAQDTAAAAPLRGAELQEIGVSPPFVLRTGGYTQRKHVDLLLAAWPHVRRREPSATLVLVGPPHAARAKLLADAPDLEGIRVLDYVESNLVARLVASAACVASPSLYEGFGLPVLEALIAGKPVVALRTPFAVEVCGSAALFVDDDPAEMGDAVYRVISDSELRAELGAAGTARAREFSWERAARTTAAAYAEATDGRPGRRGEPVEGA